MPRPPVTPSAQIEALATATPDHDVHQAFINWASPRISDTRTRKLFERMVERSGIEHRWSVLPPTETGGSPVDAGGFYDALPLPPTSARMVAYARYAPQLALAAIAKLDLDPTRITHLVVASCTGFAAPGIDQIIARKLGLSPHVERTLIGFMGCYAGVTALRAARHIVRSEPDSVVLLVSVELSTLHLDGQSAIEPLLAMLQFSDGAAAAIISSAPGPATIGAGLSLAMPQSEELIRWDIGDHGFVMHLSGAVPRRIEAALTNAECHAALFPSGIPPHLAIHAGGRSILDAVEHALDLRPDALADSRATLRDFGNMSSATILFTIERLMRSKASDSGLALAFGPGLAAEAVGLTFTP
ncbi:MAG: type III polyketide synthase [Sphingopyxis sp.]